MIGDAKEIRVDWTLNTDWRLVKILRRKGNIEVGTRINHLKIREKTRSTKQYHKNVVHWENRSTYLGSYLIKS